MASLAEVGEGRPALLDWRIAVALFAAAIAALLAFSPELFNDGDTYWHVAAGRLIIDTRGVPATDPFSFTFRGQPWTAHEWLAEVLAAAAYRLGAWPAAAARHVVPVLCGYAIWLGRFERWNSWDLVLRPQAVLAEILPTLLRPHDHPRTWAVTVTFAAVVLASTWIPTRYREQAPTS